MNLFTINNVTLYPKTLNVGNQFLLTVDISTIYFAYDTILGAYDVSYYEYNTDREYLDKLDRGEVI